MKSKKFFVIFILWIAFIYSNSLIPATESTEVSQGISVRLYEFLHLGLDFQVFHIFIRKCAHFVEYMMLGILAFYAFKNWKVAICLGILVACFDETIQLFVEGRSGQISDVLLDSCGVIFGNLMGHFITICSQYLRLKIEKNKLKTY